MGYRLAIIGPESTGKTTLARHLAKRCGATWVAEYARGYVEQLGREYTYDDVISIARHQLDELRYPYAGDVIFDTEMIITKVWLMHKYGSCPAWIDEAIKAYPMDRYLLLYPDIAWKEDPVRENGDIREELFQRYEAEIRRTRVPYSIVRARERALLLEEQPERIGDLLDRLHLDM